MRCSWVSIALEWNVGKLTSAGVQSVGLRTDPPPAKAQH